MLYAVYQNYESQKLEVIEYRLKDGLVSDISKSGVTYKLTQMNPLLKYSFVDVPTYLQDDNKLWLVANYEGMPLNDIDNTYLDWMGYINLTDMSLKPTEIIIKKPYFDKFPSFGFSRDIITNEYEPSLYIIGGSSFYGKSYSNVFYKYNFTTNDWVDMASISKNVLYPINGHSTIVVDNRYLYLLGGFTVYNSKIDSDSVFSNDTHFVTGNLKKNSLYNIWIYDIFEKNWEFYHIDIDIFDRGLLDIVISGIYPHYYKENIYLVGVELSDPKVYRPDKVSKFGLLNVKTKKWTWNPLYNEDGSEYNKTELFRDSVIFNDQIILISGI
jgi:hypothetical protein